MGSDGDLEHGDVKGCDYVLAKTYFVGVYEYPSDIRNNLMRVRLSVCRHRYLDTFTIQV